MDEKIKNLWNNNKILFFLLIPIILIVVFRDLILALLFGSARKTVEQAKAEDAKLTTESNAANLEAEKLKAEADMLAKQIGARKESDIPLDWNKKKD